MNQLEILVKARDLIKDPKNWCQQALAKDVYGTSVNVLSEEAHSFCALGAICKITSTDRFEPSVRDAVKTLGFNWSGDLENLNDETLTRHDRIMVYFDKAINKLRSNHENDA